MFQGFSRVCLVVSSRGRPFDVFFRRGLLDQRTNIAVVTFVLYTQLLDAQGDSGVFKSQK